MTKWIAIVGAGGKTTTMKTLAKALRGQGVLLTTSTRIYPICPPACDRLLPDPAAETLCAALAAKQTVCAGTTTPAGKLAALPDTLWQQAAPAAEWCIYEADGAHCRPLKLHRPDEPVLLPQENGALIVVAGLSALGRPVREAVHRYERYSPLQMEPQRPVGPEELLYCVRETLSAAHARRSRTHILLNQADTVPAAVARQIEHALQSAGWNCRAGSLYREPEALAAWLLTEHPFRTQ